MKRKIGEIYNKPIVTGDKNLVTKNEVHKSILEGGLSLNPDHDYLLYFTGNSSSKYSFGITDLQTGDEICIIADREESVFPDQKMITYTIEEGIGGIAPNVYDVECITVKYNGKHNDPRLEAYYMPGSKYWCNDNINYVESNYEIVNMYNLNSTFYRMLKD